MNIAFDHYHNYLEIKKFLQECVIKYPDLCRIEVLAKTHEDRDLFMLEVTNKKTGPGREKPGVYTDGNTHAGEVTGAEVVLYTIKRLLEGYGKDQRVTDLLDTRVFYFIPRITVDGSEHYLTTPYMLRSSLRQWPKEYDDSPGLFPSDVDGDGKILQMRVKNPDGNWKVSEHDPRLMIRRRPDDTARDGIYYDVFIEGLIRDYDPDLPVKYAKSKYQLDFNRQYPANWAPPFKQRGSGDFPFSEPEMKAVGDFFLSHPNIVTSMAYHTSGGLLLRPLCTQRDPSMDPKDLALYRELGEIGREITGYEMKSVFESFTYDQSKPEVGSSLEWAYEHLGILAFETELWDMYGRAGIPKKTPQAARLMTAKEREEEGLKLLKWNDEKMGGRLFVEWRPFDHPQLGRLEIGGWEPKMGRQNPPPELLLEECEKNAEFNLTRAAITPRLVIDKFEAKPISQGVYQVVAVIKNEGYLPTYVTSRALASKQARPVKVAIECPRLVSGKKELEIGHLDGRGSPNMKKKVIWVVGAGPEDKVSVTAETPRAGKARASLILS